MTMNFVQSSVVTISPPDVFPITFTAFRAIFMS